MMWKEKYKVGVKLIDEQHEELFRRVSDFIETVQSNDQWEDKVEMVKKTMDFMKEYVVVHFQEEEEYQAMINYPGLEEHKKAHYEFKQGINNYITIFQKEGFSKEKIQEFGGKLMTWLIMHVGKMDQRIGDYAKSKGGKL